MAEISVACTQGRIRGRRRSFFAQANIRTPWLKFAVVILPVVFFGIHAINTGATGDGETNFEMIAPMQKHVKVPDSRRISLEGKKLVALTFDDGPRDTTTPLLLDYLKEWEVPATFFVLGSEMLKYPEVVEREIADGHEVESHTMWHQNLAELSGDDLYNDLNSARQAFIEVVGHEPKFIRPPYGSYDLGVQENAGAPLITWSVDSLDWKYMNTESILHYAQLYLSDGGIILMHDIHPTTIEAVPYLIDVLRGQNYEFVTVSELIEIRHAEVHPGEVYGSF